MTKRSSEFTRIDGLARLFREPHAFGRGVDLGIGDDACVLVPPPEGRIVVSVDEQVEGTHFRRDMLSLHDLGYRSLMAATSDLAAMAATPWCVLTSLVLPASLTDDQLMEIARGQREAARRTGSMVVGGNLARGEYLAIGTTVLGTANQTVTRSGAQPGDGVYLSGMVGLASLGFRLLSAGLGQSPLAHDAVTAWRRPEARVDRIESLSIASSAIDVSDGLAQDAAHIAKASGVRLVLDESSLLAHVGDSLSLAKDVSVDVEELLLYGGEDYALLATSPDPLAGFSRVGIVEQGAGVGMRRKDGGVVAVGGGWDHFAN